MACCLYHLSTKGRYGSSSIVGRGNHIPADMPCQNQIDLLTGASFIQWVVLCTHPFNYLCLNKKIDLKEKKPYDFLYSWYLRSRCFITEKQSFGLSSLQSSFGISRNAPLPFGEALVDIPKAGCGGDHHLASAMDSQSRTKGSNIFLLNFDVILFIYFSY